MIMSSVLTGVGAGDRCFANKLPSMQQHRVAYLDTNKPWLDASAGGALCYLVALGGTPSL